MKDSVLYKDLVEPAHWVGLRKCDDLLEYLRVSGGGGGWWGINLESGG